MKYRLKVPWFDTVLKVSHDTIGEIVEMNDKARAENLIRLGAFEPIEEEVKEEKVPKDVEKTKKEKGGTKKTVTKSSKKK